MGKKDSRLYVHLALDFDENEKILPLSDGAFRALVEMILYSRRTMSDGRVSKKVAAAKWLPEVCLELLENDPEKPSLTETETHYIIRDFCEHQTTKSELEALRNARKEAGRKGGKTRAKKARAGETSKPQAGANSLLQAKSSKPQAGANSLLQAKSSERESERDRDSKKEPSKEGSKKVIHNPVSRGTRLPDGWRPLPRVYDAMASQHPGMDLEIEIEKFVDYWQAKTGSGATKLDWNATWRNWVRRASEYRPTSANSAEEHPIQRLKRMYLTEGEVPF